MKCAQKVAFGQACTPSTSGEDPCEVGECDSTSKTCAMAACN